MKESLYKKLAVWQRQYVPAILTLLASVEAVTKDLALGIIIVLLTGANTALGKLLDNDSKDFFSDKDIIQNSEPYIDEVEEEAAG